jgi:uncharacterized protein (TIRG00374 family)
VTPIPVIWRRTLHILAGLIPLTYGVWRWQTPLSLQSFLIALGLIYTVAVLLKRGHSVWGLAHFSQGAITLIFLDLALRHVTLADLWAVLRQLDPLLMLWGMAIVLASIWLRGYRWYFLLENKGQLRPRDAVFATFLSFFGNFTLPARAGEVLRILVLGHRTGVSKTTATASVALEKLSDLLALAVMIAYLLGFSNLGGPTLRWVGWVTGLLAAGLIALLIVVIFLRKQYPFLEEHENSDRGHHLRHFLHNFVEGLRPAARPTHLGRFLLYSIISWALIAYSCYVLLDSQGLLPWMSESSRVGFLAASLLIVILVNASTLIPAGPGSAGPFQAAVVLSFTLLGTGAGVAGSEAYHNAAAFSIVYWVGNAIPSLLVGGILFLRSGLTMSVLRSADRQAADRMLHGDNSVDGGFDRPVA